MFFLFDITRPEKVSQRVAREEALTSPVGAETRNVALEAWLR
jgi:hypothetical protein